MNNQGMRMNMGQPGHIPQPGQMPQGGGQHQQRNPANFKELIFQALTSQPVPGGWQTTYPMEERAGQIWQLSSALNLMPISQDKMTMIRMAIEFEKGTFMQTSSREQYAAAINAKLLEIKNSRQRSAQMVSQPSMGPSAPMMPQDPSAFPPNFAQQYSQMQQQQQQQMNMQQGMNQQPMNAPPAMMQPKQMPQQMPQQNGNMQRNPTEEQQVNQLANALYEKAKANGTIQNISMELQKVPAEKQQQMLQAGVNPMQVYFRRQAQSFMQQRKMNQAPAAQPQQMNFQNTQNAIGMMQNPAQQAQLMHGQGAYSGMPGAPDFDLSQFAGQQAEAQRSLGAGEEVVPASSNNPALNNQFGNFGVPAAVAPSATIRPGQGPNRMAPQQNQQQIKAQQMRNAAQGVNQAAQMMNQGQALAQAVPMAQMHSQGVNSQQQGQARGNVRVSSEQDSLQGQAGGLRAPSQGPQSSPAMRMLTQSMAPPNDPQARQSQPMTVQQSQQSSSSMPARGTSQQPTPAQPLKQIPNMMNNIQFPPGFPANLVQRLVEENAKPDYARHMIERWQVLNASNIAQGQLGQQISNGQQAQMNPAFSVNQQISNQGMMGNPSQPMQQQMSAVGIPQVPIQNQLNQQGESSNQARIIDALNLPRPHIEAAYPNIKIPQQCTTWATFKHWLERNPGAIPENARGKLAEIQFAHFQSYRQRPNAQNANIVPQEVVPLQEQAKAQPPNLRDWVFVHAGAPQLRPLRTEEVQAFRAKSGATANSQSDQSIKAYLMGERLKFIRNSNPSLAQQIENSHREKIAIQQPGQAMPNQGNPQMPVGQNAQMQHAALRAQAMQMTQNHNPMSSVGQVPQSIQPPNQMLQQAQMLFQSQIQRQLPMDSSMGSNMLQGPMQGGQMPNMPSVQAPQIPALNPQQLAQMTAEERKKIEIDLKTRTAAATQHAQAQVVNMANGPPPAPATGNAQGLPHQMIITPEKEQQFNHIVAELKRTTLRGPGLPFDQVIKEVLASKCRLFMPLIARVESCIKPFYACYNNDELIAEMIRCCLKFRQQKWNNDELNFTIRPEELESIATRAKQFWEHFGKAVENLRNINNSKAVSNGFRQPSVPMEAQAAPMPQAQPAPIQVIPMQTPKIARRPSGQKKGGSKPPAAPTSDKPPPVSFPAASPHGTPVYANHEFHAEKLTIPVNKRRKGNTVGSASNTPLQPITGILPQPHVSAPAKASMAMPALDDQMTGKVDLPFKCKIPDCEYSIIGFDREEECNTHMEKVHEYTGNALEYCLRNMRKALGLDDQGKTKVAESDKRAKIGSERLTDPVKNDTLKKLAVPVLKREGKSPGASPMSRGPSVGDDGSTMVRTDQINAKYHNGEGSSMKRTASTAELAEKGQKGTPTAKDGTKPDLWANSLVSPEALRTVFGCFDILGQVRELPENTDGDSASEWASASPVTNTPETGNASRPGDVSETADLQTEVEKWDPFFPGLVTFGEAPPAAQADKDEDEEVMFPLTQDAYMEDWRNTFGEGASSPPRHSEGKFIVDEEGYVLNYDEAFL